MLKRPAYATFDQLNGLTVLVIGLFHLLALSAFFTFSVPGLVAFLVLGYLTGSWGISFAYHRLLTHGSFKTHRWVKYLTTFFACMALEGGPIFWVSTHRYHHKKSDQPLDPHSPVDGFWWAHMTWLFFQHPVLDKGGERSKIVSDLNQDPVIRWLEAYNFPIVLGVLASLFVGGYAFGGPKLGLSLLVWGGLFRIVCVWHVTWLINSATHLWGYQNYPTRENSTNCWWIAWFSFGEGWHNNHHGNQLSASFWHRWFEVDITYALIFVLEKLGLVWQVIKPKKLLLAEQSIGVTHEPSEQPPQQHLNPLISPS